MCVYAEECPVIGRSNAMSFLVQLSTMTWNVLEWQFVIELRKNTGYRARTVKRERVRIQSKIQEDIT